MVKLTRYIFSAKPTTNGPKKGEKKLVTYIDFHSRKDYTDTQKTSLQSRSEVS